MRQLKISNQVIDRDTLSLGKYLQEIGKVDLLSAEKEAELSRRIKKGDRKALEMLVKANLRFVVSVSKQYQNQGLSLPDLISEGNLGLIKAAERFDETRGFKFISYAVWWIRQSILQTLAEQARIVRLPLHKIGSINKVSRVFNQLEQELQREPTPEEIAEIMDMAPELIEESIGFSSAPLSMDAPVGEEGASNMYDLMMNEDSATPDGKLIGQSLEQEVERSLATLRNREAEILRYYFGLKEYPQSTLEEIGSVFGLTRERVRQVKKKAIDKLKNQSHGRLLMTYLSD